MARFVDLVYMVRGLFDAVLAETAGDEDVEKALETIVEVARALGMSRTENKAMSIGARVRARDTRNLDDELYELMGTVFEELAEKLDTVRTLVCRG